MLSPWLIIRFVLAAICVAGTTKTIQAGEPRPPSTLSSTSNSTSAAAQRGYRWLTTKAYLPPDFDEEIFSNLWDVWESAAREKAAKATPAQRRRMAFARYGLTGPPESALASHGRPSLASQGRKPLEASAHPVIANRLNKPATPPGADAPGSPLQAASPGADAPGSPLQATPPGADAPGSPLQAAPAGADAPGSPLRPAQYVVDEQGHWTMNCFACHQGRIAGQTIPGLPNSTFALATLTEDVRATKLRMDKPLSRMDLGSLYMPLGNTRGTTNAVMFGVILMNFRDAELNVHTDRQPPPMVHHDLDAPPWWNYRTKKQLYYDGFVPKGHRALMQFLMVRENGPEKFREWENDYRDIEAWIQSLRPPKYPFAIDGELAAKGRPIFNHHCASCHGTYDEDGTVSNYPGRVVPIAKVATDSVRLTALTPAHRGSYAASWYNDFGARPVDTEPAGYVAPPLSGIWASAPYLHNGSVPTLWHLMHVDDRPAVWRRVPEGREQDIEGYDQQKVGVAIESFEDVPEKARSLRQRREYFDTRQPGKSAAGHTFPEKLMEGEKRALLEYLKTL